jgi:hypothetical protein
MTAENKRFQRENTRTQSIDESKSINEQNAHLFKMEKDLKRSQKKEYKEILDTQIEIKRRQIRNKAALMSVEEQCLNQSAVKFISGQFETAKPIMDLKPTPLQTIVGRERNHTPQQIIKPKLA